MFKSLLRHTTKQQGYALVVVVWVLALLTMLAISFSGHVQVDQRVLTYTAERQKLEILAEAAIQKAIYVILNPAIGETWKLDGTPYPFTYKGTELAFAIQDESGKIDLNIADRELLLGLLRQAGSDGDTDDAELDEIVDAIEDWKDQDDLPRLNGAEYADYEQAESPFRPANQVFTSVSEVQQVYGVTPEIFEVLAANLTVYSQSDGVNLLTAPEAVLKSMPGVSGDLVDEQLELRSDEKYYNPDTAFSPLGNAATTSNGVAVPTTGPVYSVVGYAKLPSGHAYQKEMVIWVNDPTNTPAQIIEGADFEAAQSSAYWILEVRERNYTDTNKFEIKSQQDDDIR